MAMMGDVVMLMGVETFTSRKKDPPETYTRLHLVYDEGSDPHVVGNKVESVFCPREVDPKTLFIGKKYQQVIRISNFGGQMRGQLIGLERVEAQ